MTMRPNTFCNGPDEHGRFGIYGGRFVAETLMPLILELDEAYEAAKNDPAFHNQLNDLNTHYAGRPSPLYFAERLTAHLGGAKIYFKRDELNHTGSHKINNCLGQILLARGWARPGSSPRPAPASTALLRQRSPPASAFLVSIYMGATDVERQKPNVFRMKLLGRRTASGQCRQRHAQGRDERGAARLGDQCRDDLLPDRDCSRTASLSGDGARFPVGHR